MSNQRLAEEIASLVQEVGPERVGDIHVKPGSPIRVRDQDDLQPQGERKVGVDEIAAFLEEILRPDQWEQFENEEVVDTSYGTGDLARFRAHIFHSHRGPVFILRPIPLEMPSIESANLPRQVKELVQRETGLMFVIGGPSTGKSTTLAAMVADLNGERQCHIVVIEDPIEFLYEDDQASISQLEVGSDVPDVGAALDLATYRDPDVVALGTFEASRHLGSVLRLAESGCQVIVVCEVRDTETLFSHLLEVASPSDRAAIRRRLARVIRGVVGQTLLPRNSGEGSVPVTELAVRCPQVVSWLEQPAPLQSLHEILESQAATYGTHSFDQSLMRRLKMRQIDIRTALEFARDPAPFERLLAAEGLKAEDEVTA